MLKLSRFWKSVGRPAALISAMLHTVPALADWEFETTQVSAANTSANSPISTPATVMGNNKGDLQEAKALAEKGRWRESLDISWAKVAADPFDHEARALLVKAYEALGYMEYAQQTRAGFFDSGYGAYADQTGHGGRSAGTLARKPVEGSKFYLRGGIGVDSNPGYTPSEFSAAFQQTFGVAPTSNSSNLISNTSNQLSVGFGGEFYRPIKEHWGIYLNGDLALDAYSTENSAKNQSLSFGFGLAHYDTKKALRIGLRGLAGKFGSSFNSDTRTAFKSIGVAVDYGRNVGMDWSFSTGLGFDRASYQSSPVADFNRLTTYFSLTKSWIAPWRPSIQLAVSGQIDRRVNDSNTAAGLITGPDRNEKALSLTTQLRPVPKLSIIVGLGLIKQADDSPNWSSTEVTYTTQNRVQSSLAANYQWSNRCAIQGRLGNRKARSNAMLYSYDKTDLYAGVSCWVN